MLIFFRKKLIWTAIMLIAAETGGVCSQSFKDLMPKNNEIRPAKRCPRYSKEKRESVIALYKANKINLSALSRQTGVSTSALSLWTMGLNRIMRTCRRYTAEERKLVVKLYFGTKTSYKKLANKLDIPKGTIRQWIFKAKSIEAQLKYTTEEKNHAVELCCEGNSVDEVARQLNIPAPALYIWLSENKDKLVDNKVSPPSLSSANVVDCLRNVAYDEENQSAVKSQQCGISSCW